jgi:ABC-type thiamine transport system substrate-binding protein
MFVFPVVQDSSLPEVFTDDVVTAEAPHSLDPALVAAMRRDWVDRWTDVVLR